MPGRTRGERDPVQCVTHRGNTRPSPWPTVDDGTCGSGVKCWRLANQPTRSSVNTALLKTRRTFRPRVHRISPHQAVCIRCREVASCRLATLNASGVVVCGYQQVDDGPVCFVRIHVLLEDNQGGAVIMHLLMSAFYLYRGTERRTTPRLRIDDW
ncbi:unnamed protein product, partial [Ascophyllum nodosum]